MKINTQKYGEKNVLKMSLVKGTNDLYVGEISVTSLGWRYRVNGLFDKELREVIPFGEFGSMRGIRVIDDGIIIVDKVVRYGDPNVCCHDEYGSILIMKKDGQYQVAYNSNAAIILVTNDMLFGAHYDTDKDISVIDDEEDPRIITFEYNYKTGELVRSRDFSSNSKTDGYLETYLLNRCLPYPDKMNRICHAGKIHGNNIYSFETNAYGYDRDSDLLYEEEKRSRQK